MPRTTTVEAPGCPPLRVLTFDSLGLIKVVEARGKQKQPQVVDRWGAPDSSRYVLAASIADHRTRPLLAVARKNGLVELVNPLNGDAYVAMEVSEADTTGHILEDNLVSGLHLFKRDLPRESALLACTAKGIASLRSIKASETSVDFTCSEAPTIRNVCAAGKILCSSIDGSEKYAVFGGKGVEVRVWDLEKFTQFWTAKHPPSNSNGLFAPTWFTATTFLSKDDHRKIVAGTNNHQVRLYDISAQRRPVISFDFRESPIKVVTEDLDGQTIYVGNGCGDLASFDMRTGKLLGCFVGKCSGSVRSIVRHPEYPLIASCGLDSWLRFWDTKTRKPLAGVFLKQHLNSLVIDANFKDEEFTLADTVGDEFPGTSATTEQPKELQMSDHPGDEDYTEWPPLKRKKSSKSLEKDQPQKVKTSKQVLQESDHIQVEGDDKSDGESESLSLKRRKTKSKNKNQHKKLRSESESSESEVNNELRQHMKSMKSKERDQHKKVKLKHKESDGTLIKEDIDSEGEDERVHAKHKKLPKSKSRDREVKSKTRNDVPEKSDATDADGDDKSEVDDGSLRPKRKKLSKSEVRGQLKAKSKSSKKRTQDDGDKSDDDEL